MDSPSSFEDQLSALLPRLRRFAHALSRNSADADRVMPILDEYAPLVGI